MSRALYSQLQRRVKVCPTSAARLVEHRWSLGRVQHVIDHSTATPMDDPTREEETGLAGGRPRQRSSIPSFLFISLILFMLTSHNGDEFLARHQYQDALRSLEYQLSNYTVWMNGTSSNFTVVGTSSHYFIECAASNERPQFSPIRTQVYLLCWKALISKRV